MKQHDRHITLLEPEILVAVKTLAAGKAEALHLLNADTLLHAVIKTHSGNLGLQWLVG
tara:strand:- start:555 stop:728 length:174 start_codon:yes stop_codon:yes gene_type:complete